MRSQAAGDAVNLWTSKRVESRSRESLRKWIVDVAADSGGKNKLGDTHNCVGVLRVQRLLLQGADSEMMIRLAERFKPRYIDHR